MGNIEIYEAVMSRLAMLGYTAAVFMENKPALDYWIAKCRMELLANINRREMPDGLFCTWVDMAAGSFLHDKLAAGDLDIDGLDFSPAAKSITEGDVKVEFSSSSSGESSAEARFRSKLDAMMHPPESVLGAFRRLRW